MDNMTFEQRKRLLSGYFEANGMLLCNESRDLPYLEGVGGDWNSIIALIEEGKVFLQQAF